MTSPHSFKRRTRCIWMFERGQKNVRDIRASNAKTPREWQRLLRHFDGVLSSRTVQKHARSNNSVIHATHANLVLGTTAPHESVSFPEIQGPCGEVLRRYSTRSHVKESS